jgi:hypothetical protein
MQSKKILKGEKKGKWAEVMPQTVWSHNTIVCRATNFTSFWLMYRAEVVLLEEVKHRSLGTTTTTPACPCEAKEKDLLESDNLEVVANLQKYQEETRAWRDPKVNLWEFEVVAMLCFGGSGKRNGEGERGDGVRTTAFITGRRSGVV